MNERLGLIAAMLSMGGMMDMPVRHSGGSRRMTTYSDPKRQGHFEKKQAKSKRRKELAKQSRKRNRK